MYIVIENYQYLNVHLKYTLFKPERVTNLYCQLNLFLPLKWRSNEFVLYVRARLSLKNIWCCAFYAEVQSTRSLTKMIGI